MAPKTGHAVRANDPYPRVNILGVGVSAINQRQAVEAIEAWIAREERTYVCVTGVHGVMESQRDEALRRIHNEAGLVTPDGMPLVWLSRVKGFSEVRRVYGPDLVLALCARSKERAYRHFFYGGVPGVPDLLAERLRQRYACLKVVGTYSPSFRELTSAEDDEVVERINAAAPDIVWVGLSTPKQEHWMASHRDQLTAPVLVGVGAAFDYHAGLKKQAPRWVRQSGLEWLFRLVMEPRRLGPRYLVNNPAFLWSILLQGVGLRRHRLQ